MPISGSDFAKACVDNAFFMGVNPHVIMATAQLLSGIQDNNDGDRIGPFRIKLPDWKANGKDDDFEISMQDDDINDWRMQCTYAALQIFRAQESLRTSLKRFPTAAEIYAVWPKDPPATTAAHDDALAETKGEISAAVSAALAGLETLAGDINLNAVPAGRQNMATLIVNAFAAAGYGKAQQIAAVANAIAESNLNPEARSTTAKEDSVGLFQLNMKGGVGTGHTPDELEEPAKNTELIINKANTVAAFKAAATIQDAVAVFVAKIEQPANTEGEIIKRMAIAKKIIA